MGIGTVVSLFEIALGVSCADLFVNVPDARRFSEGVDLSGHKESSRAFARYRDIDDAMLTDLVSKLN